MAGDGTGRALQWLLLEGDRHVVAVGLLVCIHLLLLALGGVGVIEFGDPDAVRGLAGGLIPGLFTFLSIVLAINQLVLTQEFGSADEIRTRVSKVRAFREDVEAHAAREPSPILPTAFLALLAETTGDTARGLADSLPPKADDELERAVSAYVGDVTTETRHAAEVLRENEPGRVNAILAVLAYPDSQQLYEARRLRQEFDASLPSATRRELAELIDLLELFSVARTHFRTTYTQRVLARLSRLLLYVGVPAIVAAFVLHLVYPLDPSTVLGRYRLAIVSALLVVSLAPIAVLFSYILRIATVSERTIAVGPFLSRPREAEGANERPDDASPKPRRGHGQRTDE